MTIRTWLSAALAVGLVSLSSASGQADSRMSAQRYQPSPVRMEATRIAQARSGRAVRAEPPPAPARTKAARLDPKPNDAARQAGSASNRTARARR